MYCSKDCACSLCRELRGFKPEKPAKRPAPRPPSTSLLGRFNENFILRKRNGGGGGGAVGAVGGNVTLKSFQPQSLQCSEMCQSRRSPLLAFENSALQHKSSQKTPSPTRISKVPSAELTENETQPNEGKNNKNKTAKNEKDAKNVKDADGKPIHKVVIYFGDSIANRGRQNSAEAAKAVLQPTKQQETVQNKKPQVATTKVQLPTNAVETTAEKTTAPPKEEEQLPTYIESVQNGIINIKIEGNYQKASALVESVSKPTRAKQRTTAETQASATITTPQSPQPEDAVTEEAASIGDSCDWSFVQKWRTRYKGSPRTIPINN